VAAGAANPDAAYVCDYMIMTESEMARDPVYEWYREHDLTYFIGSNLADVGRYRAMWSLQRTRMQGHAQGSDIELFLLLKPHIRGALILADQLGTLRSYHRFNSALFDALPQAVFALDETGGVLLANSAADGLIAAGDGIWIEDGRLRTSLAAEQASLEASIRSAIDPPKRGSTAWTRASRPSRRLPYAIFVGPLQAANEELIAAGAKALVVVHDPCLLRVPELDALTSVYGLTETQARLASALGTGHSLESAAASLHMQPATARSHLKCIFAKLGVNRQQDLVRILTSLASILP